MNAYDELMEFLEDGEAVDAVVFGDWGWGWDGCGELGKEYVPNEKRGRILSLEAARPLMDGWSFEGGFGAPECYAVYIWTNRRVIWVTQYDGSTRLDSAPRNPSPVMPYMPGG